MISAEVGPPSSIVAAWITHRHGISPPVVSTASPRPIGARPSALGLHRRTAGARDRARHAAAVQQPRVGRVGDRIDLQLGDVGVENFDPGHGAYVNASGSGPRSLRSSSERKPLRSLGSYHRPASGRAKRYDTSAGSSLPASRSRPRRTAAMNFERLTSSVLRISSA